MKPLFLFAACIAAPALAAPAFQDTVAIDRAVAGFTGRSIGEDGGARAAVDARLRLATCPMVALAWHGDRHDAVVVSCTGPDWRVFVPVRFAAAATPAAAASTATVRPVVQAPVIKRGDLVTISAGAAGFAITRDGVAMADAAPGARFPVKCDDAKAPVQAVAIEAGRATLPGWGE